MEISITKKFKFEAAHSLPNHDGKCKNLHGHSYVLEVTVKGEIIKDGPKKGMVMDFADLSKVVEENIIKKWDHQFLNDLVGFDTTAENLAIESFQILEKNNFPIHKIKLFETEKSFVEIEK